MSSKVALDWNHLAYTTHKDNLYFFLLNMFFQLAVNNLLAHTPQLHVKNAIIYIRRKTIGCYTWKPSIRKRKYLNVSKVMNLSKKKSIV